MFSLPFGPAYDKEIVLSDNKIIPFDHGAISTYIGRRKTPAGHRLVRGGRVVAWLAEPEDGEILLCGLEAKERLEHIEAENHRLKGMVWSIHALGKVAQVLPEAFAFPADKQGLLPAEDIFHQLMARDVISILDALDERLEVRGAMAVDQGILVEYRGDLPGIEEDLAVQIGETLTSRKSMAEDLGLGGAGHWILNTGDGALLLVEVGNLALAIWTELEVNHHKLVNAISAKIMGQIDTEEGLGQKLPSGFVLRKGKSGTDAIISMLQTAMEEKVTGHLSAGKSENSIQLIISNGLPLGLTGPEDLSFEDALESMTSAQKTLELHRLPAGTILTKSTGSFQDFSLSTFCSLLSTTRTRTESRQHTLQNKLEVLFGFEIGLEALISDRSKVEFDVTIEDVSTPLEGATQVAESAGMRRAFEKAEHKLMALEQENATLQLKLEESEKSRLASKISADDANVQSSDLIEKLESSTIQIDGFQLQITQLIHDKEEAVDRADRLTKRVNELEYQLNTRATELARALGDSKASAELASKIEEMANKEALLSADITLHSTKLTEIRDRIDGEERRLRLLNDQVEAARDKHRRSQSELIEVETRINSNELHLKTVEAEAKIAIDKARESQERAEQDSSRREHIQMELKELMEERRNLLREIGDIGARRGHVEAELTGLIEQTEALTDAHEEALADIQEAEVLRARLSEEPLAQALLNDTDTFAALGPVIERLEHARMLGYSVTMLDRAVERVLQVIQQTVDHVAKTPRHLLSNEVMALLERQVPATAGAVRGLARWSVQQRLEHQLGETVNHLILDLETLLEDYDRSITMLRRIKNVLEQLEKLGAPQEQIQALMVNCKRPESLPHLAKETRRLIQEALDDIHIESDLRDAGSAVKLEETIVALEELITQLDASGLTNELPMGALWDFQRDGLLPWEKESLPQEDRLDTDDDVLRQISGTLIDHDVAIKSETSIISENWEEMEPPKDEEVNHQTQSLETESVFAEVTEVPQTNQDDERAMLEDELARLDARWEARKEPNAITSNSEVLLNSLEDELSGVEW